ncbi:MAG TPA: beta-ketoacyl synthase N-terminal-like domain-containing protein [Polyangiaceae bacterium]|nr:beta-ketoacyl synthase N-terminal-like domain-containing protein [Polyangiaceae bacterium]
MEASLSTEPRIPRRIGVYGWGVVAPGARDVAALEALLQSGRTALRASERPELGAGLFAVGDPDFTLSDYDAWIAARHGDAYLARMRTKMGENVQFAVGATIQALQCDARLEPLLRELDDECQVFIGSGVSDLPESYRASASLERATRAWNHFWGQAAHCAARRRFESERALPPGAGPPTDPASLPTDSGERWDALGVWDLYWAARSDELRLFLNRFGAIERMCADDEDHEKAHLNAIRKRVRAHRALVEEVGCPPPPWTAVSPNLIWNIQNAPAAQITMLLDVHGAAWAPVGACSTFGVALKCGRDAILRGEARAAIVGTTDPRPDAALVGAFHSARVMPGIGEVNMPFTSLRGTHVSGGSCVWIIGDADWCEARGLKPVGGYVEAVTLSSDAEHIITPSKSGPRRAIARAYEEARITASDVGVIDLHATGTPGDLNELALIEGFVTSRTRITARKGQLGHGMANSGGWELTALALGLCRRVALPTGIAPADVHPRIAQSGAIVTDEAALATDVGVKIMLGIGGLTACVVLRR